MWEVQPACGAAQLSPSPDALESPLGVSVLSEGSLLTVTERLQLVGFLGVKTDHRRGSFFQMTAGQVAVSRGPCSSECFRCREFLQSHL